AQAVARLHADEVERGRRQPDRLVVPLEAVAARARIDLRLDVTFGELPSERDRLEHLLDELGELPLVVAARLGLEEAAFGDDVPRTAAPDRADIRGRLVVEAPKAEVCDRPCSRGDRRAAFLRIHARV